MSLKHIAKYRSRINGNTAEEEIKWLKVKREINLEKLFGVDEVKKNKRGNVNNER